MPGHGSYIYNQKLRDCIADYGFITVFMKKTTIHRYIVGTDAFIIFQNHMFMERFLVHRETRYGTLCMDGTFEGSK